MYKPLTSWIERSHPIPKRFYVPGIVDKPEEEWAVFLSIEEVGPLHLAPQMNWIGLKKAREETSTYLQAASELIDGLQGGWLDREEREWILEEIGEPPSPSLPIYLITCSDDENEKLVYVGKTKNSTRFFGGHAAALKMHAPEYLNTTKKIYRSTVWFHHDDEYISLDWIQPEDLALELLDSVESHLIFRFQPVLNKQKKKNYRAKWEFYIHIQNFLDGGYLHDTFV